MPRRIGDTIQIGKHPVVPGTKVHHSAAESASLFSTETAFVASHATSLHGKGPRDMQETNGYQNGFGEAGFEQSLTSGISSMPYESGSAKERCHHADVNGSTMVNEPQGFLQRASGTSQESGDSQSGSDEAPKQRLGGLWPGRGKKKKKSKEKVEKDGSDKANKRHKGWQILGSRAAERSGPSSSSPSASSPSKLSDSSDALAGADAAEAGIRGEQMLRASSAAISAAQAEPLVETVSSPPVASSGCLGMFMRGKSEEVTIRAPSQPSLTTEGRKAKKGVEKLPQRASRRSSEAAPRAISNGSHGSTSSAVSSRRSSFEEVRAPATDGDMQVPQSGSQWYLKFSAFAAASKQPTAHESESPGAGQGAVVDLSDICAGEGGRVSQSSDGGPAKNGEQAEKKAHRRNHSLGSYFTSFVTKRTASVPSNLDKAVEAKRDADKDPPSPKTPRNHKVDDEGPGASAEAPAAVPPKTPELSRNQSALACFGFSGKVATGEDGDEEVENSKGSKGNEADAMPSGSVGLKNLGNTCFINSALQVLRWTPGFPELLVPDLLSMDPLPAPPTPAAGEACAKAAPAPPFPTAPTELGPLCSSVAALSALAAAPDSLGGPQTADFGQSSGGADEEPCISSPARSDSVAPAEVMDGSGAPLLLPTIRENSPSIAEPEPLAPVRTRSVVEVPLCSQAAELAADSVQQVDALGSTFPAPKSAALSEGEPGVSVDQVETGGHAKQEGSPLGPETPAICEVPFPVPSLAGSPESIWGQTPAQSDASTGSAQAAEEQQTDPSTGSKGTAAERLQSGTGMAGVSEPAMQQVPCACGMHTVGVPAKDLPRNGAAALASRGVAPKLPPLERGEMAAAFCQLTKQVFRQSPGGWVDPSPLVKKLYQLPQGAEFQDGGQHDCQEALRSILMGLHDDLNRVGKPGQQQQKLQATPEETGPSMQADEAAMGKEASKQEASEGKGESENKGPDALTEAELEAAKADREWARHLAQDNSIIYDLFSGQLQSSIKCHKCNKRFTTYEVFLDLSLPLTKEGKGGVLSFLSKNSTPSIEDCLQAFTTDEVMQGDEAFQCEHCNERTTATKHFRIHRLPKVLVLHIKRFKYTGTTREKITTNVTFPLKNLSLQQFMSEESGHKEATTSSYDLFAVSNHQGSIGAGHYMAVCKAPSPPGSKEKEQWYCFNDVSVKKLAASAVPSPNAYLLCYYRKDAEATK